MGGWCQQPEHAGPEARLWLSDEGVQPDLDGRIHRPPFSATSVADARRAAAAGEAWRLDLSGAPSSGSRSSAFASGLDAPCATFDDEAWADADAAAQILVRRFPDRIPTIRIGLVLCVDGEGLARALRLHFARFPGFHWVIKPITGTRPSLHGCNVFVCPESAQARLPRAVAALREEAARGWAPLLFLGAPLGSRDDADPLEGLPARIAALFAHALQPLRTCQRRVQTSFPFPRLTGRDVVRLPPSGPTVSVQRIAQGVRLEARYDDGATRSVSIALGAGGAVVRATEPFASRDALRLRWFAATRDADPDDVFGAFADAIAGRGMPCHALLEPLVRRARIWLRAAVPRPARSIACAFHPRVAAAVAMRIAADASGRVAQLARVCPGLFSLAVSLRASTALDEACARTIAGARLAACLEPVLEAWQHAAQGPRDVGRHASFVKRAPAALDPEALRAPFPPGLVLDDLPADTEARTAWFTAAGALAARAACEGADDAARLAPFVSARGVALGRLGADECAELVAALVERGRTLGHWASRATDVEAARARSEGFAPGEDRFRWAPKLAPPTNPNLQLRMLTTPAELAAEGERMGHCVATYTPTVARGELLIFAVDWLGARYTASAVVLPGDALALAELQGHHAAGPPPRALWVALTRWLTMQRVPPARRARARRSSQPR